MKPDKVSSSFWMVLGMVMIYASYKLKLGTLTHPGPGFLPFLAGVILWCLSIVVFLKAGRRIDEKAKKLRELWAGMNWLSAVIVVVTLLVYALVFTHVGFLLSTIGLLTFLFRARERMGWFAAIGGALIASFASFAVFAIWLKVQLPYGIIEKCLF
jgi:putative tricarboxylic transport membrane protein